MKEKIANSDLQNEETKYYNVTKIHAGFSKADEGEQKSLEAHDDKRAGTAISGVSGFKGRSQNVVGKQPISENTRHLTGPKFTVWSVAAERNLDDNTSLRSFKENGTLRARFPGADLI